MSRKSFESVGVVLLLGAAAMIGCAPTASGDKWADHTQGLPFVIGYEAGMAKAQAEKKPVMLFFTTTWCPPCKQLASTDLADAENQKLLEPFVLVIVDGDQDRGALEKYGVNGFPHILFQNFDGTPLAELNGYHPGQFREQLEQAVARLGSTSGA